MRDSEYPRPPSSHHHLRTQLAGAPAASGKKPIETLHHEHRIDPFPLARTQRLPGGATPWDGQPSNARHAPCHANDGGRGMDRSSGVCLNHLRHLEQDEVRYGQFCFSCGEAIHAEGRAGRWGSIGQAARQSGRPPHGNPKGRVNLHQILRAPARPYHRYDRRRTP